MTSPSGGAPRPSPEAIEAALAWDVDVGCWRDAQGTHYSNLSHCRACGTHQFDLTLDEDDSGKLIGLCDRCVMWHDGDNDALQILCRVFDDGADVAYLEWLEWRKPSDWMHPSRALGAFIHMRLERRAVPTGTRRELSEMGVTRILCDDEVDRLLSEYGHVKCPNPPKTERALIRAIARALPASGEQETP